ncbi:MAG: DUF2946 domain-containing protein [Burkholderiaceae bacterium]
MSFYRVHRRFAAWLAMCVMVLSALAPVVAQAMVAASDRDQWIEVCSVSGMVLVKADGAAGLGDQMPDSDAPMGDMAKHCPWCSFHGNAVAPPTDFAPQPLLAPVTQALPEPAAVAFASKSTRSQQARAPPTLF